MAEREADSFAAHMIALLQHGEEIGLVEGHCPLCNAARSDAEFATAIEAARVRLQARGEAATRTTDALAKALLLASQAEQELAEAKRTLEELDARRARSSQALTAVLAVLARYDLPADPLDTNQLRSLVLKRQEETAQLEHALFMLEIKAQREATTQR